MSDEHFTGTLEDVLVRAHKDFGAHLVVLVPHGFTCTCVRSCVTECDCETDEDGASMLVQGIKLRRGKKTPEGRLPLLAIDAAVHARRTVGLAP